MGKSKGVRVEGAGVSGRALLTGKRRVRWTRAGPVEEGKGWEVREASN